MRLESCTFHNMGPFSDFTLDLRALGDDKKLIALVGRNGQGKSFSLEAAIAGACYRKMPTNGTLVKRATARDSWLEARVHYGQSLTIRHLIDAVSGSSEAVVTCANDKPAFETTSVKKFDAWAAKHLPDEDVLFASIFAAQQSEGFVKMGSAERIDVILRVIGVARLERMAAAARKRQGSASTALEALIGRIGEARGATLTVEAAEAALAAAEEAASDKDRLHRKEQQQLEASDEEARRVADLAKARVVVLERRAEIEAAIAKERAALPDVESRIKNNRAVLADAEAIRAAGARLEALPAELAAAEAVIAKASAERAAAQAEMRAADAAKSVAGRAQVEARARADRARARLADADQVRAAAAQLQDLRDTVVERAAAAQSRANELEAVRGKRLAGADDRIVALRDGFGKIMLPDVDDARDAPTIAADALDVDDRAVTLAAELPVQLRAAEAALRTAQESLAAAQRKLADTERLAARLGDLDAAQADLDEAEQAAQAAEARWEEIHRNLSAAIKRVEAANRVIAAADTSALVDERDRLTPIAAKAQPLAQAEARLEQLVPLLDSYRAELARLEAKLAATPAPPADTSPAPVLADFEARVRSAEQAGKDAAKLVTLLEARLETARVGSAARVELERKRATAEAEVADWSRLASDLGKEGLQAAEIDSAGPELTELTNDLLRNALGPRFTVSFETTRQSADGKRQLEGCEVRVLDTVKGRDAEASTFSGGEKVMLSEAVSLALAMLGCRRSGLEGVTLVRDESGAALDPENARAYVAMLRRAAQIVRARHVLFVSHSPEVQELADARILVGGA
jgi:exonuclease SbcC